MSLQECVFELPPGAYFWSLQRFTGTGRSLEKVSNDDELHGVASFKEHFCKLGPWSLGKELIEGNVVDIFRRRKMKTNHCLSKQKHAQLGGKADSGPSKRRGSPLNWQWRDLWDDLSNICCRYYKKLHSFHENCGLLLGRVLGSKLLNRNHIWFRNSSPSKEGVV